jgi:hypothetical protein
MGIRVSQVYGGSTGPIAAEIRRALGLLVAPGECHEVRALPSARSRLIRGDDLEAAVDAVLEFSRGTGVYLTVNPVRPDLGDNAAKNADITRRRDFYIDVDPVRPAGTNASDGEHEAARVVAEAVRDDLDSLGWPMPLVVDSGSGWHLHYLIDLPSNPASYKVIARALKVLAGRHNTDAVKVDTGVHNASRIARIPGTINRKGPNFPDRPHRPCRLVSVPAFFTAVDPELIRSLAGAEQPASRRHVASRSRVVDESASIYARSALEREVGKVASAGENRNTQLHISALKLGGYIAGGLLDEPEVVDKLSRAGRAAGLGSDGDPHEVERAIANGLANGKLTPKYGPTSSASSGHHASNAGAETDDADTDEATPPKPLIVWAKDITPKRVEFLWPGRIPLGKMTTFAGHGGLGKTFVICDIAARVTTGDEWPFAGGECAEPGNVLFISGEDDEDDTLVPRLNECGADLSRIAFLTADTHDNFTLAALDLLSASLDQMTDVRLVAIDPPTSYLGGIDDHKNSELRSVLGPLKRWASEHRVAVILNTHVNKATGPNVDAASRVMGSVAWVNAVRAAHMFVRDPDDKDRVIFAPLKMNNAKRPMGLAYTIKSTTGDMAKVEWIGTVDQDADEAINKDRKKPRQKAAAEWIAEMFVRRREWPSEDFWRSAKENGVSKNAIDEYRHREEWPKSRRSVLPDGTPCWTWYVPPGWTPQVARERVQPGDSGDLD